MPEDYRPTEPVHSYEFAQVPPDDEPPVHAPGPAAHSPSLWWIAAVVAVFMAVPLLASLSTRSPVRGGASAASQPARLADPAPEAAPRAAPAPVARAVPAAASAAPAAPAQGASVPLRALPEPERQMVTKCVEHGRVVYTQTGECVGSVSALPIDTSKNVVGPARGAPRQ